MRSPLVPAIWLICVLGSLPAVLQGAEPAVSPDNVEELAGRLASDCAYLLEPDQRDRVRELNRRLREARARERRDQDAQAQAAANAQRVRMAREFFEILDASPRVVSVSWVDGRLDPRRGPAIDAPGDFGAFLLRVRHGDGPTSCFMRDNDMAQIAQEVVTINIDLPSKGTTWILILLRNIPVQRSSLLIQFNIDGQTHAWPIDVHVPQYGRLRASIIAEDTGEPTPAMVRLMWKSLDRERVPAGAIDFAPQFDSQGSATGRRHVRVPGHIGEYYWCVPGPIDQQLPPGDYELTILHGVEYLPLRETFTIRSGELVEKRCVLRRWVDMRKLGWYSGDDHVHGRILSSSDAEQLLAWAQAEDVHVVNIVKMGDIYRTWFEQRGWGKAYRIAAGDIVLSPGQECPRTHQIGHTISMNTTQMNRNTDRYFIYEEAADAAHAQGGLWGYAHVLSKMFHVDRDMSINIPKGKCDFVELMQFGALGTELYYDFLNLGFKVTASAGSDVPWGGTVGEVRIYAYVGDAPFDPDAWFEAVRRGRTFTTNGPMIDFRVEDALPGDEIRVTGDRKLRVRARAWGHRERMVPTRLEIVRQGDVIEQATSKEPAQEELRLDFEVEAGHGFWIAARVHANNGAAAHTTPIYVIREGLRFWKFDQLDELFAKRMKSLDEVEQIVADAQRRKAGEDLAGDRALDQLARQGPDLLERVQAARRIYAQLRETAERERAVRSR